MLNSLRRCGVSKMLGKLSGKFIVTLTTGLLCGNVLADLPVIPGAHGFGMTTPAGRGGSIIRVTNLNDDGSGSLRACVSASGPRICIFEVSGVIRLSSGLTVSNPNLTIAGQTAPAPGILLRGAPLAIRASDVLVQHIAVRVGDDPGGLDPRVRDTLKIETPNPIRNAVIDHCSISWSVDEGISTYRAWDNVTISNSIISEALNESIHPKGAHSYGALLSTNSDRSRIAMIGNIFAHNDARNPRTNASDFVFVNNVIYNTETAQVMLYNRHGISSRNTIVGNVFIDGPDTRASSVPIRILGERDGDGSNAMLSSSRVYLSDNTATSMGTDQWSIVENRTNRSLNTFVSDVPPTWTDGLDVRPTRDGRALDYVLSNAGTRPAERNAVDARVIADIRNRTGRIINCVANNGTSRCAANAGGWPNYARNTRNLSVPSDPNGDSDGDGYTNVEEWLQAMAAEVEGTAVSDVPADSDVPIVSDVPRNEPPRPKPPTLQD